MFYFMWFAQVDEFSEYEDQGMRQYLVDDSFQGFPLLAFGHYQELLNCVFHIFLKNIFG